MNRIIKFRAFKPEFNQMFIPDWLDNNNEKNNCIPYDDGCYNNPEPIQTECILMQFTGLTDKNGFEIFEGDILIPEWAKHAKELIQVMVWNEFNVSFALIQRQIYKAKGSKEYEMYLKSCFGIKYNIVETLDLIIIGNIYQNKDLLND